jgi:prophage DNA circulation protein
MAASKKKRASFRGVSFYIRDTESEGGRRTVLHEYPFRDSPYAEDLGRATLGFQVKAIFIGKTATDDAKLLIAALEEEGPGLLVHPWCGRKWVSQNQKYKAHWPRAVGGNVEIDISFVDSGQNREPDAAADTDAELEDSCKKLADASAADMALTWLTEIANAADEAAKTVEAACAEFQHYLDPIYKAEAQLDRILNAAQRIINAPLSVAKRFESLITRLVGKLSNPFAGATSWSRLISQPSLSAWQSSSSRTGGAVWMQADPSRKAGTLPAMPPSLTSYVRRMLLVEAVRTLPTADFSSKAEVQNARATLLKLLEVECRSASDTVYPHVAALRLAVARSIAERLPTVADIRVIETRAVLPALLVCYRETGGISAFDDLVSRNAVRHPGFVSAGQLEVLKNA